MVVSFLPSAYQSDVLTSIAGTGVTLVNAVFLAWWGPSHIASWERQQSRKMLQLFGMIPGTYKTDNSKKSQRKRFHGTKQKSAVTGEYEVVFSHKEAAARVLYSNLCSALMCMSVLSIVVLVSGIQFVIYENTQLNFGSFKYNY
ncbi:unnamed protein product, partial [Amoebophrya sp. A25]|eukprot:GSA25T00014659001.1